LGGRFISRDPVRKANPYIYANNNPVTFIDPSGRNTVTQNANIALALSFIQQNLAGSGISSGILNQLQTLFNNGQIVVQDLGNLAGGWNGKQLILNITKLGFLNRTYCSASLNDMQKQLEMLLQLSGFLIHEGEHAYNPQSGWQQDELNAFQIEQLWYYHLYQTNQGNAWAQGQLRGLASDAQYDAATASSYTTWSGAHPLAGNPSTQSLIP
jgi:hypothetical protein